MRRRPVLIGAVVVFGAALVVAVVASRRAQGWGEQVSPTDSPVAAVPAEPLGGPWRVVGRLDLPAETFRFGHVLRTEGAEVSLRSLGGETFWRYSRDGERHFPDPEDHTDVWLESHAPAGDLEVLYFDDDVLVGLDLRTGHPRWHQRLDPVPDREARSTVGDPRVVLDGSRDAGVVVIFTAPDRLEARDIDDGERRWSVPLPCDDFSPLPHPVLAVHDAAVAGLFEACEEDSSLAQQHLVALSLDDGRELWRQPTQFGLVDAAFGDDGPVLVPHGVATYDHDLQTLDARTGRTRWRAETGAPVESSVQVDVTSASLVNLIDRHDPVDTDPATPRPTPHPHEVAAVDLADGRERWRMELPSAGDHESVFVQAVDGFVYVLVIDETDLVADETDGDPVRTLTIIDETSGEVVVTDVVTDPPPGPREDPAAMVTRMLTGRFGVVPPYVVVDNQILAG